MWTIVFILTTQGQTGVPDSICLLSDTNGRNLEREWRMSFLLLFFFKWSGKHTG